MTMFDALLSAIGAAPALPGAKCRHRHHLFDEAAPGEAPETTQARHAQALGLCHVCPALASCAEWFDSLRPNQRPEGVVAGQLNTRPTGRPRKATSVS